MDVAVISGLEKRLFDKKDFVRTENYNIRIRPKGVQKLMDELTDQFSSKVHYCRTNCEWSHVITKKAGELAKSLGGETKSLDFSMPEPNLHREDSAEIRKTILSTSYADWRKMGYSKGTLHYLKKNAKNGKPFKVYGKVRDRLVTPIHQ